jgi:hypothetical protein
VTIRVEMLVFNFISLTPVGPMVAGTQHQQPPKPKRSRATYRTICGSQWILALNTSITTQRTTLGAASPLG